MSDFRDYPRLSEDDRKQLYSILNDVCTIVSRVRTSIKGTYDGQMTTGCETTVQDYLFHCLHLYDARDAIMKPKAPTRKEKLSQAREARKRKRFQAKTGRK